MAWRWTGTSIRGTSHLATDSPCQDASRTERLETEGGAEWLVITVSDGAGSAIHGDQGSRVACEVFESLAAKHLHGVQSTVSINQTTVGEWLNHFHNRIQDLASDLNATPRDFAATLLLVLVGDGELFSLQLGDGAVVYSTAEEAGTYALTDWPDSGEYENQTYFLTESTAMERFRMGRVEGRIDELAVFTDGLQRLALDYATRMPHPPFFIPFFRTLGPDLFGEQAELADALGRLLGSDQFNARTNDDKTLVIASRRSPVDAPTEPSDVQPDNAL